MEFHKCALASTNFQILVACQIELRGLLSHRTESSSEIALPCFPRVCAARKILRSKFEEVLRMLSVFAHYFPSRRPKNILIILIND